MGALVSALDDMYIEQGASSIMRAVEFAARYMAGKVEAGGPPSRRALILLTGGDEREWFYDLEGLLVPLRREGIRVYVTGYVGDPGERDTRVQKRAVSLLSRLASFTFFAASTTPATVEK